jgi:hypothetical protein
VQWVKQFSLGTGHAVPFLTGQHSPLETLWGEMGMNVDGAHRPPKKKELRIENRNFRHFWAPSQAP